MVRRWIIRIIFMLPILLCMAGWGWSGTHSLWIRYSHDGRGVECESRWGVVVVLVRWHLLPPDGWRYEDFTHGPARFWPVDDMASHAFLGFDFGHFGFLDSA